MLSVSLTLVAIIQLTTQTFQIDTTVLPAGSSNFQQITVFYQVN